MAAPLIPKPSTKMNNGSRIRLATAPIATESMPVVAYPCALINGFILAIMDGTVPTGRSSCRDMHKPKHPQMLQKVPAEVLQKHTSYHQNDPASAHHSKGSVHHLLRFLVVFLAPVYGKNRRAATAEQICEGSDNHD